MIAHKNTVFPTDNFNPFNLSDFRNNPLHLEPRLQHVGEDLENGTLMLNF